jgi:hypothetical protein
MLFRSRAGADEVFHGSADCSHSGRVKRNDHNGQNNADCSAESRQGQRRIFGAATCAVCRKPLADGNWFCRLHPAATASDVQAEKILLCSPGCASRHFASFQTGDSKF